MRLPGWNETHRLSNIVWLWYLMNLAVGLLIVAPLTLTGLTFLSRSMEGARLLHDFDLSWLVEFAANGRYQQFLAWIPVAGALGTVFLLLTTFLSGGTLATLENPNESFFVGCARWFPPFFRLMLMSLPVYASVIAIRMLMDRAFQKLNADSMTEMPAAVEHLFSFGLLIAALCVVNMMFDYAKIHMVLHGDRRAWRAFGEARHFVILRFGAAAKVYATLFFCGLLMLAVYHVWSEAIGQASGAGVFVVLVFRQVYLFYRTKLRVAFLVGEHQLMKSLLPPPPEPMPFWMEEKELEAEPEPYL